MFNLLNNSEQLKKYMTKSLNKIGKMIDGRCTAQKIYD